MLQKGFKNLQTMNRNKKKVPLWFLKTSSFYFETTLVKQTDGSFDTHSAGALLAILIDGFPVVDFLVFGQN